MRSDEDAPQAPALYEIRVVGQLDPHWSEWFAGLELAPLETGETVLTGALPDQAALHGLLDRICDLNLTLVSVRRVEAGRAGPSQEASP